MTSSAVSTASKTGLTQVFWTGGCSFGRGAGWGCSGAALLWDRGYTEITPRIVIGAQGTRCPPRRCDGPLKSASSVEQPRTGRARSPTRTAQPRRRWEPPFLACTAPLSGSPLNEIPHYIDRVDGGQSRQHRRSGPRAYLGRHRRVTCLVAHWVSVGIRKVALPPALSDRPSCTRGVEAGRWPPRQTSAEEDGCERPGGSALTRGRRRPACSERRAGVCCR